MIPGNDFSFYDQVLDALVLVGATPSRFGGGAVTLGRYFQMARNSSEQTAMEMTKWFDTNYHYLVPEWSAELALVPDTRKVVGEFKEALALGILTRPVLLGPVSLLLLGKGAEGWEPLSLLPRLLEVYKLVLQELAAADAEWVQIDEPCLVTDLSSDARAAYRKAYDALSGSPVKLMLTTYFGSLGDNLDLACSLQTAGLHVDAVRGRGQVMEAAGRLKPEQTLSVGCIDGRNIWLADLDRVSALLNEVMQLRGVGAVQAAPS
ncbi:MAG: 5-methyltetrahydropteroyltriglutamate/homocysteine S-methyltransferase [Acidobacteriaceae bacterium]|nr:5-methyltetrahydropteroyltriglutamate/homocysteine S-methyltransferase [Acidobacteriaceae bacterium]